MKYVMFCRQLPCDTLQFEPVIFGNNQVHVDIAKAFIKIKGNSGFVPISAGEFNIGSNGEAVCSGRSETLDLNSNARDAAIIDTLDYGGGLFA